MIGFPYIHVVEVSDTLCFYHVTGHSFAPGGNIHMKYTYLDWVFVT